MLRLLQQLGQQLGSTTIISSYYHNYYHAKILSEKKPAGAGFVYLEGLGLFGLLNFETESFACVAGDCFQFVVTHFDSLSEQSPCVLASFLLG